MAFQKLFFTTAAGGKIQFQNNSGGNVDLVTTTFTTKPVVRLGDTSNHGGSMTTATSIMKADGLAVCQNGDSHTCPITGHGTTPVTATTVVLKAGTGFAVRVGDVAGCGAVISRGSPTLQSS